MIQNMTIGKRLATGFLALFLLFCVYSINNYIHLSRIEYSVNIVSKERLQKTILANKIIDNINIQTASYMNMLVTDSKDTVRQENEKIQKARSSVKEHLESLQKLIKDDKETALMKKLMEGRTAFISGLDSYLKLVIEKEDKTGGTVLAVRTVRPAQLDYLAKVDDLVVYETESTVSETESALENIKESKIILVVFALLLLILMTVLGTVITRSITVPLKQTVEVLNKAEADGNFKIRTDYKSKDEIGLLCRSMNSLLGVFESMLQEVNGLTSAAQEGRLSVRAETSQLKGGFREIVGGINNTLDAVVTPLNVSADYVDRISKGIIPSKITDVYKGDFNSIKNNLNICIDSISGLVEQMNEMSRQHTLGEIDAKIDSEVFSGAYREMAEGINKMVFDHIQVKKSAMGVFKQFSEGSFSANIDRLPGKKVFINETIDEVRANLRNLTEDVNFLSAAAIDGKLSARADADRHKGDFRKIVTGINSTLDAVIRPVQEAAEVLEHLSEGNLTQKVKGDYKGDHSVIKNALNKTIESFNEIIGGLTVAAEEMQKGVSQITDSNHSLSQGSSEQAASIEEISSTITELSAQTRQASANAKRANDLSLASLSSSRHGSGMMSRLMEAMQEIKDSAHNISKILAAIDEIAFQTNLLSLNAAVEAARAGRHGKGFAVVAEEVKSLSARSANAAKETAALIQESIQKANRGVDIAEKTVKALDEIGTGAENVAGLMLEVSKSSEEQAVALSEVEKSIQQIEQVIQNNAFSSEETAAASVELSEQAEGIDRMVKRFKISELPVHIIKTEKNESGKTVLHRSESGRIFVKKKNPSEVISL